ncbi:t-SNARE [Polyporus arcularius HHB13444]|uniref:t-SNARE n=1 Tax=Polyporus arcularius HHB13444 TaxID=1314778 RepID=A0A5C3PES4_9APHY|nr:t-SNARE [Polyporus arcularius HHB13444]
MSSSSSSLNPTTRSRTLLFISYRDSRAGASRSRRARIITNYDAAHDDDDEHERLINAEAGHISIDAELPPKWVDIADQVKEIIAGIQTKIAALDKLHAKHVLPGFSDRSAEEKEIEAATTDITKDFRQCQTLIQRIGSVPSHTFPPSRAGGSHHHHELAAKNVQRSLAAKVQELSATFRKKQRVYMEKLQGHAIKNQDLLAASGAVSLKGSAGMSALDEDVEAAAASSEGAVLRQVTAVDLSLDTRDRELTEIAKSIAQLAELFKDLSALVIDQGTLLDSVEYNVEQTAVHMEDAVKELETATRYQKNTGRRSCIFLLLLIIFGLIIVLIFKPRRHHSAPAPAPSSSSSTGDEDQTSVATGAMTLAGLGNAESVTAGLDALALDVVATSTPTPIPRMRRVRERRRGREVHVYR